jgi:hypothetical protein
MPGSKFDAAGRLRFTWTSAPSPAPPVRDNPGFGTEFDTAQLHPAALGMAELILRYREWVHRVVEVVQFQDADTVIRDVRVEFTIPCDLGAPPVKAGGRDCHYVPVALLGKRKVRIFDFRDEDEQAVPYLTARVGSELAREALLATARGAVRPDDLPGPVEETLRTMGAESAIAAAAAWSELTAARGPFAAVYRRLSAGGSPLPALAATLAADFPLLVPIAAAPARRCLRFSYEEPIQRPGLPALALQDGTEAGLRHWLLRHLGWKPFTTRLKIPVMGRTPSYHFELQAPAALQVSEAELLLRVPGPGSEAGPWQRVDREFGTSTRTHLYPARLPPGSEGRAKVQLRLLSSTLVRSAWLIALFASVVLTLGAVLLDRIVAEEAPSDAAAAVLVTVPSVLALFLARPGEPDLTTELSMGIRLLSVLTAALTFVAAGSLVVARKADPLALWVGLACASWSIAAILSVTWWQTRRRPPVRPPDPPEPSGP